MESPFEVLDVDPDASEAEVERAYRERIKESHPDLGGTVAEFRAVKAAYEQISNGEVPDVDGPARRHGTAAGRRRADRPSGASEDESDRTLVEYLDFEVVVDRGWDLSDGDLFEKAASLDLDPADYGQFVVDDDETLLAAAERHGYEWPYSCRGGACANCAVTVLDGELSTPVNHILPDEVLDRDVRLSCVGEPLTDELRVVFNVKHLPDLDELRLPPHPAD